MLCKRQQNETTGCLGTTKRCYIWHSTCFQLMHCKGVHFSFNVLKVKHSALYKKKAHPECSSRSLHRRHDMQNMIQRRKGQHLYSWENKMEVQISKLLFVSDGLPSVREPTARAWWIYGTHTKPTTCTMPKARTHGSCRTTFGWDTQPKCTRHRVSICQHAVLYPVVPGIFFILPQTISFLGNLTFSLGERG